MPTDIKLCACALSHSEKDKLLYRLDDLLRFLSSPGDWGYGTKLGTFTQQALAIRQDVRNAEVKAETEA